MRVRAQAQATTYTVAVGILRVQAGRAPPSQPWAPTKFAEEPKEARRALAEGGVSPQAPATIAALTVVGGSCHGGREGGTSNVGVPSPDHRPVNPAAQPLS